MAQPNGGTPVTPGPAFSPVDSLVIPMRASASVSSRSVAVPLGAAGTFELAVLPIRENRAWKTSVGVEYAPVLAAIEDEANDAEVRAFLEQFAEVFLTFVLDYDQRGARAWSQQPVLPSQDELEAVVTPQDVMVAFLALWTAANPFSVAVTVGSAAVAAARAADRTSPAPTNGSRRSTGGRRTRSKSS